MNRKYLEEGISQLQLDDSIIPQLHRYIKEIETFNPAYGLVSVKSKEELIVKHILDSLAPLGIIKSRVLTENQPVKIADVGSGAGLPGIPLAIALPDWRFTLIERMGKRANFLLSATALLALKNVTVEENEVEKTKGKFNLVTFRAFSPVEPKLLKTLSACLLPNGIIAAYKGRREKIEKEMKISNCEWEAISYNVPFLDEDRHLLVITVQ